MRFKILFAALGFALLWGSSAKASHPELRVDAVGNVFTVQVADAADLINPFVFGGFTTRDLVFNPFLARDVVIARELQLRRELAFRRVGFRRAFIRRGLFF